RISRYLRIPMSAVSSAFRFFFFFYDAATTEIYTLSLHDALPIWPPRWWRRSWARPRRRSSRSSTRSERLRVELREDQPASVRCGDRKSTRLNSSHSQISYAVFCLKKKKKIKNITH